MIILPDSDQSFLLCLLFVVFVSGSFRCNPSTCDDQVQLKTMVLEHEYGINTGNRFINFVDHDEDPEEFIAGQTQPEEKPKKSAKDAKSASSATGAKKTTGKTTTSAPASASTTGKATKENVAGKSAATEQRRPQSNVFGDNSNNQQPRTDSARGKVERLRPKAGRCTRESARWWPWIRKKRRG